MTKQQVQVNRDVLIQVLEALEAVYGDSCDAIHALRAALADQPQTTHWQGCEEGHPECAARARVVEYPVQEPVAWLWQHRETGRTRVLMPDERTATDVAAAWDVVGPLYLAPPQSRPVVDPAEYDDAGAAERYNRGLK